MKLLSPSQVKKEKPVPQINKAEQIFKMVKAAEQTLQEHKVKRDLQKNQIELEFLGFAQDIDAKRKGLEQEVRTLEQRKAEALKPVTELKQILEAQKADYDALQKGFEVQEAQIQTKKQELEAEMQKTAEIQSQMSTQQERFDLKLLELKSQENAIKEGYRQLQGNWQEFIVTATQNTQRFSDWQRDLQDRQKAISLLQEDVQKQRQDIEANRARLIDLQLTIKAAFEEARQKNLL